MAVNANAAYFRYSVAILYIFEATMITLILLIELRTLYYSIYHIKTSLQISASKTSNVTSTNGGSTSVNVNSPSVNSQSVHSHSPTSTESTAQHPNATNATNEAPQLLFVLPILSYIFYILTGICGAVSVLGINSCTIFAHSGPPCFSIAKMFMYFVFIYRLKIVYRDSAFAYNNKILWVLFVIIIVFTLIKSVFEQLTMDFVIYYNANNQRLCAIYGKSYMIAFGGLFDIFISIFCCCLFVRPLLILNQQSVMDTKHMKNKLYDVILKYLILTAATVTSTIILATFMALLKFSSLIAIDMIINCVCILLFNVHYSHYYKSICCGLIACCKMLCVRKSK